jgi:hypothetical protein
MTRVRVVVALIGIATLPTLCSGQTRTQDQNTYVEQNGKTCGLAGSATGTPGKTLNRHKNRWTAPEEDQIDSEVSLGAMLAPGNDTDRFDQEKGATIRGYVVNVKKGGKETCNCGAANPVDIDTHIEVALSADAPETERVIVEVTPRIRKQMSEQGVDWTTEGLDGLCKGKWVQFTGWLLFDSMHADAAENTNPGGARNWRATCWEIHPVTNIQVLGRAPAPLANAPVHAPAMMRIAHREHVRTNPKAQAAIKARNDKILSGFDKDELEEKEEELREHGH